jgi:hypothetical protein
MSAEPLTIRTLKSLGAFGADDHVVRIAAGGELRVVTRDGVTYKTPWVNLVHDQLQLGQNWRRSPLVVPAAAVLRIERLELRKGRAIGLGIGVVVLGAIVGELWDITQGDPMRWHNGLALAVIGAALASPFVVWLAQEIPWLQRWHVVLQEAAV